MNTTNRSTQQPLHRDVLDFLRSTSSRRGIGISLLVGLLASGHLLTLTDPPSGRTMLVWFLAAVAAYSLYVAGAVAVYRRSVGEDTTEV